MGKVCIGSLILSLALTGCSFEEVKTASSTDLPSEVESLLNRCVQCHSGGSASGGFSFVLDQDLMVAAGYINPGDSQSSILYQKLTASPPFGDRMPKGGPYLSVAELETIANWIDGLTLNPQVIITSPTAGTTINSSSDSATYAVSGTCNSENSVIYLIVNGVESSSSVACTSGAFSGTFDSTAITDDTTISLSARMLNAASGINVTATSVSIIKDVNALTIGFTTPSNANGSLRSKTGTDGSFITSDSTPYTVSGTCDSNGNGRTVTLKFNGTLVSTSSPITCNGSTWSGAVTAASLDTLTDGSNHKLTAVITKATGAQYSTDVYVFKNTNFTVSFDSTIKPLLTTRWANGTTNSAACVECHYQRAGGGTASANFALGYWSECTSGGRPTTTTQMSCTGTSYWNSTLSLCCQNGGTFNNAAADRSNFVFQISYTNYSVASVSKPSGNGTNWDSTGLTIVNDKTDSANSVMNHIVRGNPAQSFLYQKISAADATCLAQAGVTSGATAGSTVYCRTAQGTSGGSARMPNFQTWMIDTKTSPTGTLSDIYNWINEGARTDN